MSDIHLLTALEELRVGRHAAQFHCSRSMARKASGPTWPSFMRFADCLLQQGPSGVRASLLRAVAPFAPVRVRGELPLPAIQQSMGSPLDRPFPAVTEDEDCG